MMIPSDTATDDLFKELGLSDSSANNKQTTSNPNFLNSILQSDEDSACDVDRWASSSIEDSSSQVNGSEKAKELEEEHNRLSESVLTLSTHFAHIQFRLQQINAAPAETRDEMLKELLDFASQGCIDITDVRQQARELKKLQETDGETPQVKEKRAHVLDLIQKLRSQTEDLEKFAYDFGHGGMPMSELKERQKLVFDKLQEKIRLKIELEGNDHENLKKTLDEGLEQVLNPIKEKDKLVDQLQTQIVDLERFVQFLQQEPRDDEISDIRSFESAYKPPPRKSSILSMLGISNQRHFERNELKKRPAGNHYGDQRAQLELAVDKTLEVMKQRQLLTIDYPEREDMTLEELNQQLFELSDEAVVSVVRKQLATCLKLLLEHGMKKTVEAASSFNALSYLGFGCMSQRGKLRRQSSITDGKQLIHVWNIIELYYEVKKAEEREDAAVGHLTQTFNLDSVAGKQATSQQVLLATIENIATSHDKLKRSLDSKWKAFVSAALNSKRLPAWIRIIFRSDFVIYRCYETWSYVCRTGCEDIRPLLEKLHEYNFDLPVDLAIRPFQQNRDAF
ncbi:unnamed protein product [Bursaphelenchus okinawaensis]|uniref:RUN domain-containing protein n=1 Tax=Bursaphelenchus okinawaensis TaxID=465554 RepID=A0A811KCG9_9BILA|nr:unnamed protein product [Bursaphelenchus okinawaensis]CAG9098878.1 unnamed protein product [Bursaphelenchus okinawaensis]